MLILSIATLGILVTMGITLIRAFAGPTLFDRVLAVNLFGTLALLFIALVGFLTERPDFLDIALAYGLLNFIGVITLLRIAPKLKPTAQKE